MKTPYLCGLFALYILFACGGGVSLITAQDKKEYVSPALPGGVPVFQPDKGKKDDKTPAKTPEKTTPDKGEKLPPPPVLKTDAGDEGGKMPLKFVRNKLSDMGEGEKGYIPLAAVMVDSDRNCWVDINSTVFSPQPLRKDIVVQISRDDKGYHLGLTESVAAQHKWAAVDDEKTKTMTNIKSVKILASE